MQSIVNFTNQQSLLLIDHTSHIFLYMYINFFLRAITFIESLKIVHLPSTVGLLLGKYLKCIVLTCLHSANNSLRSKSSFLPALRSRTLNLLSIISRSSVTICSCERLRRYEVVSYYLYLHTMRYHGAMCRDLPFNLTWNFVDMYALAIQRSTNVYIGD